MFLHSSTISPPPSDVDGLTAALAQVAERSFFAFSDPCSGPQFHERAAGFTLWILATVQFRGPGSEGHVGVLMPMALCSELSCAFAGADPGDLPFDDIADATGELANMVCGLWLTQVAGHDGFTLTAPAISFWQAPQPGVADWQFLLINDSPVACRVVSRVRHAG